MSGDVSNTHISGKTNPPGNDQERRKQADERRPMMMRRILVWDMDEKLDLEKRFQEQLARKQLYQGSSSASADGRQKEKGRGNAAS